METINVIITVIIITAIPKLISLHIAEFIFAISSGDEEEAFVSAELKFEYVEDKIPIPTILPTAESMAKIKKDIINLFLIFIFLNIFTSLFNILLQFMVNYYYAKLLLYLKVRQLFLLV